jgi:hypothetical protein
MSQEKSKTGERETICTFFSLPKNVEDQLLKYNETTILQLAPDTHSGPVCMGLCHTFLHTSAVRMRYARTLISVH